jgi:lipopolysaccharide export system permease protein
LAVLPLLAVPMGLAAKRARRSYGVALAALILVLYQQALQFLEALGDVGRLDPRPALWAVFLLFAAFCGAVFRRSSRNPSEGGFDGALAAIERGALSAAALLPWRRRPSP